MIITFLVFVVLKRTLLFGTQSPERCCFIALYCYNQMNLIVIDSYTFTESQGRRNNIFDSALFRICYVRFSVIKSHS